MTFGRLAIELGRNQMAATFDRFGFAKVVEELGEQSSQVPNFSQLGDGDLAQSGIGQSSLLTTPLKMATVAAAFANKGVIMRPYIVERVQSPHAVEIFRAKPSQWLQPTTPQTAAKVAAMMRAVVERGTGKQAGNLLAVAGKTGTAENPHGEAHAWFIGFAPVNQPQVAIAVIVENAGSGGLIAAPLAGRILAHACTLRR